MNKLLLLAFLFITQLTYAQKVSFKIIKDKTEVDSIGAITLYVKVINKSKNNITILKPATDFRQKWRYYDVKIECNEMPLWAMEEQEKIAYIESDLLVITSKSKVEIIINGRQNANLLACYSKIFQLKLTYDAGKLIEDINTESLTLHEKEIVKRLTPIKIESKETKIEIH